ncbi:hypothetical protein R4K54_03205 [Brachyspira murdochii]|uniref:Conserved hypothetical secreted protein n=1 Tax=Brachyspira suanatina TaxID=381802 RepID=A0A0G4K3W9_9SPIR|nr:hypothetical protein [Brachyspira suanatina]CRF31358.1 Conserved hypothetical secreted protein [Brachyspira suanatina]
MKKIIFIILLLSNFLNADIYTDWNIQNLGSMIVLVKYSTDKLGMFTIGLSDIMGDNVQIIHYNLHNADTAIKIVYDDNNSKLYGLDEYTSGSSIIISGDIASFLIDNLYNVNEVFIYCDNSLICQFELKDLTDLLNKYR